jgi:hypothetical protein
MGKSSIKYSSLKLKLLNSHCLFLYSLLFRWVKISSQLHLHLSTDQSLWTTGLTYVAHENKIKKKRVIGWSISYFVAYLGWKVRPKYVTCVALSVPHAPFVLYLRHLYDRVSVSFYLPHNKIQKKNNDCN